MWTNQQFSGDWALNPSAYKNVSHEDVDWASLAQQWIKMKEATTALIIPPPPPNAATVDKNEEKGEEPMDMETDDKSEPNADSSSWGNWPNWQQSWGWNWTGEPNTEQGSPSKEPYGYTSTFSPSENSSTIEYNHGAGSANQPVYWTGQAAGAPDVSGQKDSKPYIRSSRYTWRRSERDRDRDKDRVKDRDSKEDDTVDDDNADTLDAAKRKQLPLWIREGLEKMEREKQRKIDKEKADRERDEFLRRRKVEDEVALSKMDSVEAAKFMARSKFDSDGSEGEQDKVVRHRKSRFHEEDTQDASAPFSEIKREKSKTPPLIGPVKTREELLEDLMMNVRRTLTEILLDITTEEIETISRQVYQKARSKAPAKRLRKSQAFASIAGKSGLGLGIYGSDDDTDSDDSNSSVHKTARNSDEELDELIRQKKENFAKTEAEIEALLEAENAKERIAREVVNTSEEESDAGVGQVEHISQLHDVKKEIVRGRGVDDGSGKRRKKISESLAETTHSETLRDNSIADEKRNKVNDLSSDGSLSIVSNLSAKRKSLKRKKKRSSGSSDEKIAKKKSETSDDDERSKRKAKKKKIDNESSDENDSKDEDESEHEDYKKKHKNHDHEKRHKKSKKSDKEGKKNSDRAKKGSRRSSSRDSEDHHRSRRRSKSLDLDRRTRRRSRSREPDYHRRHSRSRDEYRRRRSRSYDSGSRRGRSRTRENEHRRNRSRSKELHRRKRSKSRETNYRRKRSRSKEVDRKHGRRHGRSSS